MKHKLYELFNSLSLINEDYDYANTSYDYDYVNTFFVASLKIILMHMLLTF